MELVTELHIQRGHPGIGQTYELLAAVWWWPSMYSALDDESITHPPPPTIVIHDMAANEDHDDQHGVYEIEDMYLFETCPEVAVLRIHYLHPRVKAQRRLLIKTLTPGTRIIKYAVRRQGIGRRCSQRGTRTRAGLAGICLHCW